MPLQIDPHLIADAEAVVETLPVGKRCEVHAAIRQARELPALATEFHAEEVLLEVVGFCVLLNTPA